MTRRISRHSFKSSAIPIALFLWLCVPTACSHKPKHPDVKTILRYFDHSKIVAGHCIVNRSVPKLIFTGAAVA